MVASPFTAPAIFRGAEDFQFSPHGGATVSTDAGHFRGDFARCALRVQPVEHLSHIWRAPPSSYAISMNDFWFSARTYNNVSLIAAASSFPTYWIRFLSAGDVGRLHIVGGTNSSMTNYKVQKVNAAGTVTELGVFSGPVGNYVLQKLDIHVVYAVGGTIVVYLDGDVQFSYSGDLTTDGVTTLTGVDLGCGMANIVSLSYCDWSEVIIDQRDTRSWSLATQAPQVAGNATQWAGLVGDVNEITLDDNTTNFTASAARIQQYAVNGLPTGNWSVVDNTIAVRALTGFSGPQNIATNVRTGAVDYYSPNIAPGHSFQAAGYNWVTSPTTGLAWTQNELNAPGYNIGVASVA
jgi:hypothetical protein